MLGFCPPMPLPWPGPAVSQGPPWTVERDERRAVGTASLMLAATAVLVPGLLASSALYPPGRLSLPGRVALSVVLGYTISSVLAFGLALTNILQPVLFVVLLAAFSLAAGIVAAKGGGFRAQLSAIGQEVRAEPWTLVAGLLVVVLIAAIKLPFSTLQNLGPAATFRYWADALELADGGRIPEQSLHWGTLYPPTVNKVLLNSFAAGMSYVMNDAPLPAIGALSWLAAVGVCASFWWFARELGLRLTAPVLPLVTLINTGFLRSELTDDLNFYRAESFGRMVAFSSLALALRATRDTKVWKDIVLAGILFGVSASTHLVPTAVALGILLWYGLFLIVRARGVTGFVRRVIPIVLLAGAVGLFVPLLSSGDLAFQATSGSNQYTGVGGYDPTALFTTGEQRPFAPSSRAFYEPVDDLLRNYVEDAIGLSPENPYPYLLGGLLAAILLAATVPSSLKPVPLVAIGITTNFIVVTLAFSYRYDAFVPANFGARRLSDYATLPVVLLLLTALEGALLLCARVDIRVPMIAAAGITVAVALLLLPGVPTPQPRPWQLRDIEYLNKIRSSVPCDARILSNRRTGGTIQALTGRTGILEGMGPHLRPQFLLDAVGLLQNANRFYKHPASNTDFLEREAADYVLLIKGPDQAGLRSIATNYGIFDGLAFLELVAKTSDAKLYRVVGLDNAVDAPRPDDFPGFRCARAPIVY